METSRYHSIADFNYDTSDFTNQLTRTGEPRRSQHLRRCGVTREYVISVDIVHRSIQARARAVGVVIDLAGGFARVVGGSDLTVDGGSLAWRVPADLRALRRRDLNWTGPVVGSVLATPRQRR
jgi:hypothetical protein